MIYCIKGYFAAILLILMIFSGCKTGNERKSEGESDKTEQQSREEEKKPDTSETVTESEEEAVGGFTRIPIDSEAALYAYDLLKLELTLQSSPIEPYELVEAKIQVVAGINTFLICRYTNKETGTSGFLSAVIYEDLDKITSVYDLEIDIEYSAE